MAKSIVKKTVVAVLILSLVLTTGLLSIKPQAVDISDNISVALWNKTGGANELTYAAVQFPSGVLPNGLNYGILDNNSYKYIGDYIEFCGCSVNSINATTDTSGYSFSTFPSTADVKYRLPIILFQNGNTIEIKVHNTYLSGIAGAPTITVKSGLTFNSSGEYSVEKDVTFKYENNKWSSSVAPAEVDITDKLAVNGWVDVGNASELKYAGLTFPSNALPNTIQYGILDNDAYKFIADYITLNGITVNSINANTDTSGYVFSTFPSTADAKYRLPVILFQNGNTIEIKIHKKYVETLGKKITVGVLSGLNISNGNKIYKVTENVNFVLENGVWSKDIPPVDMDKKVSITGFDVTGDAGELKYTRVVFEDGILPKTIGYSVIEKSNYAYIADYIAINGKTVSEINANTDVSEYNFNTFPSSVSADYALPIIVYQNGNALEVKIHRNYINSIIETGKVSGNADITVSLIKGFKLFSGGKTYMLQNNIDYKAYEYIAPDDISGKVSIDGFLKTGDENEL